MAQSVDDPLFRTAHDALVFAFNYSGQSYDRPMMNRMAAPSVGTGKGLAGLAGAAQSGMIRQEVQALGRLCESILLARLAPRSIPCACKAPCCRGNKDNPEWREAISFLADQMRSTALAGTLANALARRACVIRYFTTKDKRQSIESIADSIGINRDTASAYISKVNAWFAGTLERNGRQAVPGRDVLAMLAVEDRLQKIGVVEKNS